MSEGIAVLAAVTVALAGAGVTHNTLVVAIGVAAVGSAAGVVGSLALVRKRPLVGDAAAHATLAGVAAAFLVTGRRDLPTLLAGALVAAVAGLGLLVLVRRCTRTRDDAATALVIGGGFGLGMVLISGISARGIPGGGGLEHFLLGHTAALTAADARLLTAVSCAAIAVVFLALKEFTLLAFDAPFAAATGWPVALLDQALVSLVAVMVVVGLPAAGAVLVTALVVIPPVAARQWTDRIATLVTLAGAIGCGAALGGVALTALAPAVPTGPAIVLIAAGACVVSVVVAPHRGVLARGLQRAADRRRWATGCLLDACLRAGDERGLFRRDAVVSSRDRAARRAWAELVSTGALEPAPSTAAGWRLSARGRAAAEERRRRTLDWEAAFAAAPATARAAFSLDLPACPGVSDAGEADP